MCSCGFDFQLWLNENHLTQLPRQLPVNLSRLLLDNNNLTHFESGIFPVRSNLTYLSLAGNKLESISPDALQHTLHLQSLDLSNNLLRGLHPDAFSTNSKLSALHLSKNPLLQLVTSTFKNLISLKALSLSYLSSPNLAVSEDLLNPLINLHRLDLDNSPTLVDSLINTNQLDDLRSLQDLGLANCNLRTLPSDWPVLTRLSQVRLSGNRWHCDESMKWLREWLLNSDNARKIDNRTQDVRCASPDSVQNKPLISLTDQQLQPALSSSPAIAFPSSEAPTPQQIPLSTEGPKTTIVEEDVVESVDEDYPLANGEIIVETLAPDDYDDAIPYDDIPEDDSVSGSSDEVAATVTSSNRMTSPAVVIKISAAAAAEDEDEIQRMQRFKLQLIIAVSTVGATIVVVTIIVAAIVYVCRRQRRAPPSCSSPPQQAARTLIKYQNKNGVLYFSTPADPIGSSTELDQCLTVSHVQSVSESTPDGTLHYVVPVVNSMPVTPVTPNGYKTRVYRWEDF
jgi:Leucine rich repeat/Leucine rich repeat C-terminal domain